MDTLAPFILPRLTVRRALITAAVTLCVVVKAKNNGMTRVESFAKYESVKARDSSDSETESHVPHITKPSSNLEELMRASGTDKVWRHGYHRYYEDILSPFRDKEGARVLEIGVEHGRSLITWAKYFEKSAVDGIQGVVFGHEGDILHSACQEERFPGCHKIKLFTGDQSDVGFLSELVRNGANLDPDRRVMPEDWEKGGWDVVIDDGSHLPRHQLTSFASLFPFVRPGGLYIVEDIETSYFDAPFAEIYGYKIQNAGIGRPPPGNFVEKMKQLVDVINRHWFYRPEYSVMGRFIDHEIRSISFGGGLIWIHKQRASDDGYPKDLGFSKTHASDELIFSQLSKVSAEERFDRLEQQVREI